MKYSKESQPPEARDEYGEYVGTFESPFLAGARSEYESNLGTTNGNWTFTPVADKKGERE